MTKIANELEAKEIGKVVSSLTDNVTYKLDTR